MTARITHADSDWEVWGGSPGVNLRQAAFKERQATGDARKNNRHFFGDDSKPASLKTWIRAGV
jgi:hypothetical protein